MPKPPPSTDASAAKPQPADPAVEQAAAERQRLELAKPLLGMARKEMTAAAESSAKAVAGDQASKPPGDGNAKTTDTPEKPQDQPAAKTAEETGQSAFDAAREHVSRAVEHLQALRRLFFSIVEHLRETAQRQAQLNDETEHVAALKKGEELAASAGPLALRQQQLRAVTQQIAEALDEQAKQSPDGAAGQPGADPKQLEQFQKVTQQLAQAAKLVADGGAAMQKAGESLSADKADVGTRGRVRTKRCRSWSRPWRYSIRRSPTNRTSKTKGSKARASRGKKNNNRRGLKASIPRVLCKRYAIARHNADATAKTGND